MQNSTKAFSVTAAVMLGIGSMVGAGIFIVIGQAGAVAGNLVWLSFLIGGIAALLSGYSLAKLAVAYPSRGGMVEYLVQCYGEGLFSGAFGILFYLSQLVAIAAVAKSFGTYAGTFMHGEQTWTDIYAIGILLFFVIVNLIGSTIVARSENLIVGIKLAILLIFTVAAIMTVHPQNLVPAGTNALKGVFYAVGLTFFAYQGFSVITNTVEEMKNPAKSVQKAMYIAITLVALLYISTSLAVLGNLPLERIVATRDYALAEAARPVFGELGFKIMAATALLATASAINATLYAATEIGYTMAKEGNLPSVYSYNLFRSYEGLIVSAVLIIPMILFLDLSQITSVAALSVLLVQGIVHTGHLRRTAVTGASRPAIATAAITMFVIAGLGLMHGNNAVTTLMYLGGAVLFAFMTELFLRLTTHRTIQPQIRFVEQNGGEK